MNHQQAVRARLRRRSHKQRSRCRVSTRDTVDEGSHCRMHAACMRDVVGSRRGDGEQTDEQDEEPVEPAKEEADEDA